MATPTSTTVSDILQLIADARGETSNNTDAVRIRAISAAEADYATRMFFRLHLLRNQTATGDGTADYTIGSSTYPMRAKGLAEVFVGGQTEAQRYAIIDFFQFQHLVNTDANARLAYEYYDAANDLWKMHINPSPTTGTTIYYSYFFQPPTRTLTTERVICHDPRPIALLALADIYHGEEEIQKEQLARQEAEQRIAEIVGLEHSPAVNQIYSMGAIENQTRARGLGTY